MKKLYVVLLLTLFFIQKTNAQYSVARRWNEMQLEAIRQDLARPPVQARNLYHVSLAMYDAWAAYDKNATTYLLGKTVNGILYNYAGTPPLLGNDTLASQKMAMSFAAYRLLKQRYSISPNASSALQRFDTLMINLGYDTMIYSTNYTAVGATPAEFGNYIAQQVISMGYNDGSKQYMNYGNNYYAPVNPLLWVDSPGTNGILNFNRWQPLHIVSAVDQNNNPIASNQVALCHEWGDVMPFSLDPGSSVWHFRNGNIFKTYKDPGGPSRLDTLVGTDSSSIHFKWGNAMVAIWNSFHTPDDNTMIDISPNAMGNLPTFPQTLQEQYNYYDYFNGGDTSHGYTENPITHLPYTPQYVKRGDYSRVISQYWADGPTSETPPGHWYVILNKANESPLLVKQFEGIGDTLSDLEWDVKTYFTLGGAMHDAAISAWSLKGWYDSPRPISAIRAMCQLGQSSDSTLPHFHKGGIPLIPGYIELITATDSMAIANPSNLNKIKVKAWKGFSGISNPLTQYAGVGWTLGEAWIPYQRKGFVTPPFAGYVSGHSCYSRAGAEVLTKVTNSPYFPGGLYETTFPAMGNFLQFEAGPSTEIKLQWVSYRDASNEASLSRIYGGIHPPTDDATGRLVGEDVGIKSVNMARSYFNANALPVTLTYFTALEDNCNVNISWSTTEEKNVQNYEVWRSENGEEYTTLVATVSSKGFTNGIENFSVLDKAPLQNAIYRLIENDIDGKKTIVAHSAVRLSNCNDIINEQYSVYPIPASQALHIEWNEITGNSTQANIKLVDVLGKVVFANTVTFSTNQKTNIIPVQQLPIGNYMLQITTEDGNSFVKKITKE